MKTEHEQALIGRKWAEILMLKRDREYKDRWRTTWGNKTDLGLYRVICEMVRQANIWSEL